jgi:hypothetical protein
MTNLATPGDDRIGEILPDDGQEPAGGAVALPVNVAGQAIEAGSSG